MGNKASGQTYIVVGSKPWNRRVFNEVISKYAGQWHFIQSQEQLTLESVQSLNPRYVFFLHWAWRVPEELIENYECVCFHMTDVLYGRGGSPLQNLIIRGHQHTKLTALRMRRDFDAGPVYLREDLCLAGNAEEIYVRATYLSGLKAMSSENLTIHTLWLAVNPRIRRVSNEVIRLYPGSGIS